MGMRTDHRDGLSGGGRPVGAGRPLERREDVSSEGRGTRTGYRRQEKKPVRAHYPAYLLQQGRRVREPVKDSNEYHGGEGPIREREPPSICACEPDLYSIAGQSVAKSTDALTIEVDPEHPVGTTCQEVRESSFARTHLEGPTQVRRVEECGHETALDQRSPRGGLIGWVLHPRPQGSPGHLGAPRPAGRRDPGL
jgi:hypothetical protein